MSYLDPEVALANIRGHEDPWDGIQDYDVLTYDYVYASVFDWRYERDNIPYQGKKSI